MSNFQVIISGPEETTDIEEFHNWLRDSLVPFVKQKFKQPVVVAINVNNGQDNHSTNRVITPD